MNTNRSIEELLELFGIQNISQLNDELIYIYFDDMSYGELMKLCGKNKQFKIACRDESMWKKKVKNDYGIVRIYGISRKETAHLLFESNMINLNANWVNGKTYRELFEEGLKSKNNNYFRDLYNDYDLLPIVFPEYVHGVEDAIYYITNDPESLVDWIQEGQVSKSDKTEAYEQFNLAYNNILEDEDMINLQVATMTREFSIIAHASSEIKGLHTSNDFGLAQIASDMSQKNTIDENTGDPFPYIVSNDKQERMNRKLTKLIDPMLYVITYCLMSRRNLSLINIWD